MNLKSPHTDRTVLPAIVQAWGGNSRVYAGKPSIYDASGAIPDGQHPPAGYAVNDVQN